MSEPSSATPSTRSAAPPARIADPALDSSHRRGIHRRITRRQFFLSAAAAAAGAGALDGFIVEPNRTLVSHYRVGGAGPSVRLVQLTDLHLRGLGAHEHHVAAAVAELAPEVILITGDSIDHDRRLPTLGAFLDLLDERTPKFAVLGNWEYQCGVSLRALAREYERRNCRLLVNESVVHRAGAAEMVITGLDDLVQGRPRLASAIEGVGRIGPNHVLLAHCPATRDVLRHGRRAADAEALAANMPAFMLSGHTHGGQVNLFGYCPWRPSGSGRYVSGWYADVSPPLYVSRGIGTVDIPIRFGAPPEVVGMEWGVT